MREQIYTIPINEAFAEPDGCPICALYAGTERDAVEYAVGAAMMEPDHRAKMNELGFCSEHFRAMLGHKNRLSVALTLESFLGELREECLCERSCCGKTFSSPTFRADKFFGAMHGRMRGCYVCERVDERMSHYYSNIAFMWKSDPEFREKFAAAPSYCLPHFYKLLLAGREKLGKKEFPDYASALFSRVAECACALNDDVSSFCKSFDYRSAGRELTQAEKTCVERAGEFLNGCEGRRG